MAKTSFVRGRFLAAWIAALGLASLAGGFNWLTIDLTSGYASERLELAGYDLMPSISALLMLQACMIAVVWFATRLTRMVLVALAAAANAALIGSTLIATASQNILASPAAVRAIAKATGIADFESQAAAVSDFVLSWLSVGALVLTLLLAIAVQLAVLFNRKPWAAAKNYERGGASQPKSGAKPDSASLWDAQG